MPERTEIITLDQPSFRISKRDFVAAAFHGPAAFVVYAAPMAVAGILAYLLVAAITPSGHLVVANGLPQFIHLPALTGVILLVVLFAVVALAHAIGAAAAALVITSRALHRPLGAAQALRHAVRLLPRTLPATAALFALFAVALLIAFAITLIGAPLWLAAILLIVELIVIHPALYLFSLTAVRPSPARATWGDMRATARAVNERALLARVPLGATLAIGLGVVATLLFAQRAAASSLLATTLLGCAIVLALVVTIVAAISVVSRLTIAGLTYREQPGTVELPATHPGSAARVAGAWLATVVAVALPFSVFAAGVVVNPTGVPVTVTAEIGNTDVGLQTVDAGSGVLASLSQEWGRPRLSICTDTHCERARNLGWSGLANAIAPDPEGGILLARWISEEDGDSDELWSLQVATFSAADLQAAAAEPEGDRDNVSLKTDEVTVVDTVRSQYTLDATAVQLQVATDLVVDTSGEFPVIASLNELAVEHEKLLTVYRCSDALCASSTAQSIPVDSQNLSSSLSTIDLALTEDGNAFVTVSGYLDSEEARNEDDTALVVVPVDGEPTLTKIIDGPVNGFGAGADEWAGSQAVATSDGFAAVLYRLRDTDTLELLVCSNLECTESSQRAVPGLSAVDYFPAITVDATGRPLIATYNSDGSAVIVLSCTDATCSAFETQTVAAALSAVSPLSMELDAGGLPIVTIGNSTEVDRQLSLEQSALIVLCHQPRCGAK